MKSSFLFSVSLAFLISATSFAQTQTKTTTISKTQVVEEKKTAFQKFYDRLKVSYFGSYQSSSLGQWDNLALDEKGQKYQDYPHNLFNQVSFNYNFGWKMNFVVNPRFTINTAAGNLRGSKAFFQIEDVLVGLQGVMASSDDSKLNWWMRAGTRLSTSRGSRASNVTWNPEMYSILSYDYDKKWQLGSYFQIRYWVYGERYNAYRYRLYTAPYVQYGFNDTTRLQVFLENYSENRSRLPSQNGKSQSFQQYWQDVMIAVGKDFTPKFNLMPFIGYFINGDYIQERPLDAAWFGFWASYQFK